MLVRALSIGYFKALFVEYAGNCYTDGTILGANSKHKVKFKRPEVLIKKINTILKYGKNKFKYV